MHVIFVQPVQAVSELRDNEIILDNIVSWGWSVESYMKLIEDNTAI